MAPTYTTTAHGVRWLPGGNLISDVDAGFQSLAEDVDALLGYASVNCQEGVIDAGAFEVTQASGGASTTVDVASNIGSGALVQDDSTARRALYPVYPTGSKTSVTITAAHATLPRVDAVVVSLAGVVSIVAGTATSGATLDNARDGSHGGATIPASALHLADLLVPATDTTISNNQIRDRRKWARGAHVTTTRNANGSGVSTSLAGYAITASTMTLIDATNLAPRIECSGAPVRVTFAALANPDNAGSVGGEAGYFAPQVDGVGINGMANVGADPSASATSMQVIFPVNSVAGSSGPPWTVNLSRLMFMCSLEFTPTAGSHIIAPAAASVSSNFTFYSNATRPLYWTVEEILRQNTANNTTTSG